MMAPHWYKIAIAARKCNMSFRRIGWALEHGSATPVERYALALATRHTKEGRTDLAVEDLAWLGDRLGAS